MAARGNTTVAPRSFTEAAAALAGAAAERRPVRFVGGGTKLGWGSVVPADALLLRTDQLSRVIINDDNTVTVGAGTQLVRVQAHVARTGRMLAIDPQLGLGQRPQATVGGVIATADSGPLAHRYGLPREQVCGVTLALSGGTVLRAGTRVDGTQNGYDLMRLVCGSFGTLGMLLSIDLALHPLPQASATALGSATDARLVREVTQRLVREYPNLEALDVAWRDGYGGLLAQTAGPDAEATATAVANTMLAGGLINTSVRIDDASLWARQRGGQRSIDRAVLRVHVRRSWLDRVLSIATQLDASVVGRAALGIFYLTLNVNQIAEVRAMLPAGTGAVVLDLPQSARGAVDPWDLPEGPALTLMRDLKQSFDPAGVCNPGLFVGRT